MKGVGVPVVERPVASRSGRAEDPHHGNAQGAGGLEGEGVAAEDKAAFFDHGQNFDHVVERGHRNPGRPPCFFRWLFFLVIPPQEKEEPVFGFQGAENLGPAVREPALGLPGGAHVAEDEFFVPVMTQFLEPGADAFRLRVRNDEGKIETRLANPQAGQEMKVLGDDVVPLGIRLRPFRVEDSGQRLAEIRTGEADPPARAREQGDQAGLDQALEVQGDEILPARGPQGFYPSPFFQDEDPVQAGDEVENRLAPGSDRPGDARFGPMPAQGGEGRQGVDDVSQ
ncbi:MAG: hypothetical protein A2Y56_04495 [Candidatus Aminicenantes bacterium RBG_13_63_10]|nr:MAG: hypothetical protein A2Y56_04495 [Candidatus Aminicenantes bacterium RBG_13_63_10]